MGGHPWAQTIVATETLKDTWWKELLCQLDNFQSAVRREWGGLNNDRIACNQSRSTVILVSKVIFQMSLRPQTQVETMLEPSSAVPLAIVSRALSPQIIE